MKHALTVMLVVTAVLLYRPAAAAQDQSATLMNDMQLIARALGVGCEYCHVASRGSGRPEPKKDIARAMIAMTRELNARVQAATGKPETETTRVRCMTCHRGVTIPKPLSEIVAQTVREKGGAAAVSQYRELRDRYYGSAAYDFSDDELVTVAQRLAATRPDDAIALLQMNIEFHPRSAQSYMALAYAHTRQLNDAAAIVDLEKALEIDPENGAARGQLEQLKSYQRRRR